MFVRTLRGGLLLLLLAAPAAAQVLDIVDLRTEGLARPLALDTDTPRFSFRLVDAEPLRPARNIRIATARVDLFRVVDGAPSATPFWSTSVTGVEPEVGRGADLVYTGPALPSFATLAWRVSVDVLRGTETIRSRWAEFETGPRRPEDWAGRWIGAAEAIDPGVRLPAAGAAWIWAPASDLGPPAKHKLIHVRSRFRVPKADAATAVLLVAVDNVARIFVDGKPLGEHRDWRKWRTIELGGALGPGDDHCLAIEAENSDGPAGLLAIVNFGEGGAVDALASAKTALEVPAAWVSPDFDDGAWKSAATVGAYGAEPWGKPAHAQKARPAQNLRRDFDLDPATLRSARLYVTALGYFDLTIDGRPLEAETMGIGPGNRPGPARLALAPEWTDYSRRVLFQSYDVTAHLRAGGAAKKHAIAARLGEGWYAGRLGWSHNRNQYGSRPPRLSAMLAIEKTDGTKESIVTDDSWRLATSGILAADIYDGESFDARAENPGWELPGFDASAWAKAAVDAEAPPIALDAQMSPAVVEQETLRPKSMSEPRPGVKVFDFGQNLVGRVRFRAAGKAGDRLILRHAEILNPDGTIYTQNLRSAKATDEYVFRGGGANETWSPRFTFHGFRYLEASGAASGLDLENVEAVVCGSNLSTAASFDCGVPMVKDIVKMTRWGLRGNLLSVPTDCPQRDERLGWMGDALIIWPTACRLFDMQTFSRKWIRDIRDAQSPEGGYSDVSPRIVDLADGAPAWGDAGVFVPAVTRAFYDDRRMTDEHWASMQGWADYVKKPNADFLWRKRRNNDFGDWVPAESETPKDVIAQAFWAGTTAHLRAIAAVSGRPREAAAHQETHARLVQAFRTAFVKDDGTVGNGSQTCQALALAFDLLPENLRPKATELLVKDIEARKNHLSTGFVGTPFLMQALTDNGRADVAYTLLLQDTYPSWGYMLKKGATTVWERWNGDTGDPGMNSFNHYAFGCVVAWLFDRAAGIRFDAATDLIDFTPHPDRRLGFLDASSLHPRGKVRSAWSYQDGGRIAGEIVVPHGAVGRFRLPPGTRLEAPIAGAETPDDEGRLRLGSGAHAFALRLL